MDWGEIMTTVRIRSKDYEFTGVLHEDKAPKTCEIFRNMLPIQTEFIHVRWSGEGVWIPYGDTRLSLEYENHITYPAPGEMLLYPGGISEMEFILSYGRCAFACQYGPLAGNHFMTIVGGFENLYSFGRMVLLNGAQKVDIEIATE